MLDIQFIAKILASRLKFKNHLNNGTSTIRPYMSLNFQAYWVTHLWSRGLGIVLSPSSFPLAVPIAESVA